MALPRVSFLSVQFGMVIATRTVLRAQLNRGAIEGTVTEPQGGALSGVDVTITAVATNVMTNTETNSSGYYRAEALVPGTYRAHFGAKVFASLDVTAIEAPAAQVIRVTTKLEVGSIEQTVDVKPE